MKLLFVLPEFGPSVTGGIATYYRHLLPELVRHGHAVHIVLASVSGASPGEVPGVTVSVVDTRAAAEELHRFEALSALPDLQWRMARARAAWRVAGEGRGYDVVETTDYDGLFAAWTTQASGPPVLVQLHGSNGQLMTRDPLAGQELQASVTRLLEAGLLARADELQTYGGPNAREWSRLLRREVVHLWPAWRPSPAKSGASLPDGIEGLVVGRVQCWKGPQVLCEALRQLGGAAPKIAWVGADTFFRRSGYWTGNHLATTYPDVWQTKLVPLGRRSPDEVASLQSTARFVVVPSTWDVFNLAATEAMGRGRVVVCSDGAGAAELIRDGETGYRCPAADAAALADRIAKVRDQSDNERQRMGEAARSAVIAELDPEKVVGQRLIRYEMVAKRGAASDRQDLTSLAGYGELAGDPLAFLDRLPLRRLVRYAVRRGLGRLLSVFRK